MHGKIDNDLNFICLAYILVINWIGAISITKIMSPENVIWEARRHSAEMYSPQPSFLTLVRNEGRGE